MIVKTSKNILLADDSVFFRTKLSAILTEAGHRVRFASDGREVIKEIQIDSKGVDLLVLDLQMPEVDGFGVLEWINNNGFKGKFPVLAVTGVYDVSEIFGKLKDMGANGLMTKGIYAGTGGILGQQTPFPADRRGEGRRQDSYFHSSGFQGRKYRLYGVSLEPERERTFSSYADRAFAGRHDGP